MRMHLISRDGVLLQAESPRLSGMPWDGKAQCFRSLRYPLRGLRSFQVIQDA